VAEPCWSCSLTGNGSQEKRPSRSTRSVLYLERWAVLGPRSPLIVMPCCRYIGMAEPCLHAGNVGLMLKGFGGCGCAKRMWREMVGVYSESRRRTPSLFCIQTRDGQLSREIWCSCSVAAGIGGCSCHSRAWRAGGTRVWTFVPSDERERSGLCPSFHARGNVLYQA